MSDLIPVVEIFETICGEGQLIGKPTVVVCTGGCDYQCRWCDSKHAIQSEYKDSWELMSPSDIFAKIKELTDGYPTLITLTGGDPALHDGLEELVNLSHRTVGHRFAIETQGIHPKKWLNKIDHVIFSPPSPSAQQSKFDINTLDECLMIVGDRAYSKDRTTIIKIVLFTQVDYNFARILQEACSEYPMYLQIGNDNDYFSDEYEVSLVELHTAFAKDYAYWADKLKQEHWYNVTLLPQLHTLVWGRGRRV